MFTLFESECLKFEKDERTILNGIMGKLRGSQETWFLSCERISQNQPWTWSVVVSERFGVSASVCVPEMVLYLCRRNWWASAPACQNGNFFHKRKHAIAVMGKVDLMKPKSLTRDALRKAVKEANHNATPLDVLTL